MTVAELLDRVGSAELTEWVEFAKIEPFGGDVEDLRAGLGASAVINVNLPDKAERVHPLDFYSWHIGHSAAAPKAQQPVETPEMVAKRIKAEIFGVSPQ